MDISNIIALALGAIGFIISIVGLVITPILNLKSKQLEKRLEFRFELFLKILELWESSHDKHSNKNLFVPLLSEVNKYIQLYGYNSEIKLFQEAVNCYNKYVKEQTEINYNNFVSKFNDFFSITFNSYRKEIKLDNLPE